MVAIDVGTDNLINPQYVDAITYTIITNKLATYKELRDDYNVEEYLSLYDVAITQIHNKSVLIESKKVKR